MSLKQRGYPEPEAIPETEAETEPAPEVVAAASDAALDEVLLSLG
ncbi:hypothetical protein P4S72_03895 [Vibrio sp. PP-XX7]